MTKHRSARTLATAAILSVLPSFLLASPTMAQTRAVLTPVASVNFQPDASPVPTGFTKDAGAAFSATPGFGWVTQSSLTAATHTGLDLTRNTRDRAASGVGPTLNTLIHMQYGDVPAPRSNGNTTAGAWEYALPSGTYQVSVSVGDPTSFDSTHVLNIEGTRAVGPFTPTAAKPFATATVNVQVTDGRLTLDAVGGKNTKLDYVVISRVSEGSAGVATVSNLDGFPAANRLVFSRIQAPADNLELTHDTSTLRISNTGTAALKITGLPVTGAFALVSPPTLPVTVPAGSALDLPVRFTAGGPTRANAGTLTVQTDSATTPSVPITLAGFWQSRSEGGQEPLTSDLRTLYGWTTNIPSNLNKAGAVVAQGDEVLSPYWLRADTSAPVTVRQLNAYHTYPNTATVKWFPRGGSSTGLFSINGRYAQSILPLTSSGATARGTFTPSDSTPFGFAVDGESSDDTKNSATQDMANGCTAPCGHHVLFFPVKDSTGATVANTYYLIMDYSGINYDYNDNGYLVTNIKPAS